MRNVNQYKNNFQVGYDQVRVDEARICQVVFQARDSGDEPRQLAPERIPLFLKKTTITVYYGYIFSINIISPNYVRHKLSC